MDPSFIAQPSGNRATERKNVTSITQSFESPTGLNCIACPSGNGATKEKESVRIDHEITQSFEWLTWWTRPGSPSLEVMEQPKEKKSQEITQSFESLTQWTHPSSPSLEVTEQPKEKNVRRSHNPLSH